MKEKTTNSLDSLELDALDYMFVEFLTRRAVYSRFVKNFTFFRGDAKSPRSAIRNFIRFALDAPAYSPVNLISMSFPFRCTPEGFRFWTRVSAGWESFLKSFSKNL